MTQSSHTLTLTHSIIYLLSDSNPPYHLPLVPGISQAHDVGQAWPRGRTLTRHHPSL